MHTEKTGRKPAITVARSEYDRLMGIADTMADRQPDASSELVRELERAKIVGDDKIADRIVRMDSIVRYQSDDGETRTVTLVYPGKADIDAGRISVMTPIGTALLGLSPGQRIAWNSRDGRRHDLHVLSVERE